ncbi:hypothetical protein FN846DRAFT_707988 [Sphaerosporella brunnea]|uniref:non-specific serine/threonine protein kinase n=1 Tax=Sphaerosporella brunnea TaxID=1250544 RepID=A0A5J5EY06_9PEZI|nr:hypothetical protein FN846DRAFT_707988 [Sphaerosporella brunnea]
MAPVTKRVVARRQQPRNTASRSPPPQPGKPRHRRATRPSVQSSVQTRAQRAAAAAAARTEPAASSASSTPPRDAFSTHCLADALPAEQQASSATLFSTPRSATSDALPTLSVTDASLYGELWGRVIYDVPELWALFDRHDQDDVPDYLHDGERWTGWPEASFAGEVQRWFFASIDPLVRPKTRPVVGHETAYVPSGSLVLNSSDAMRKCDLLVRSRVPGVEQRTHWHQVRVVGVLKANPDKDGRDKTFIQLANYVRELFGTQPQRSWAVVFTLCGTVMRVFRFDRAGALASTPIDVHRSPRTFLAAMRTFVRMDAGEIGFDPTIRWTPGMRGTTECVYDPTVHFALPALPAPFVVADGTKYRIDPSFVVRRYAIASRGTVCWRAKLFDAPDGAPWQFVVKDQWRAAERDVEGSFLARIAPGTVGLPGYVWHTDAHLDGTVVDVASHVRGDIITNEPTAAAQRHEPEPAPALTRTSRHLYGASGSTPVQNRIKTRLIMTPLGQPLLSFTSYRHLLRALRDAILGHKHLYMTHGIVHRDVSLNNVLLHPDPPHGSPHGFLIDFDFAISRSRQRSSGTDLVAGTFKYMAIDVLGGLRWEPHNPIHDLESFYYVLLDICIYYDATGRRRQPPPPASIFPDGTSCKHAAMQKRVYLTETQFMYHVMPTLVTAARRKLWFTLNQWRARIAAEFDKREQKVSWELAEDGQFVRVGDSAATETDVADMYADVLGILEDGIRAMQE